MKCFAISAASAYRKEHSCERIRSVKKIENFFICPNHIASLKRGNCIPLQNGTIVVMLGEKIKVVASTR